MANKTTAIQPAMAHRMTCLSLDQCQLSVTHASSFPKSNRLQKDFVDVVPEDESEENDEEDPSSIDAGGGVGGCIRGDLKDHRERLSREVIVSSERFSVDIETHGTPVLSVEVKAGNHVADPYFDGQT